LPGLRKDRFNSAVVCDKVLDLVAVQSKERSFRAREEGILENREDEASQGKRLLPEPALFEVHQNPVALVHRFADRKRGFSLSNDVSEMRVGGKSGHLIKDGLPHDRPLSFACLVIAELEILPHLGVVQFLQTCGTES